MNAFSAITLWLAALTATPAWGQVMVKLSLLLALAWLLHFALRRSNPRWRVLLWRGVMVGLLLLPLLIAILPRWELQVAGLVPVAPAVHAQTELTGTPPVDRFPSSATPLASIGERERPRSHPLDYVGLGSKGALAGDTFPGAIQPILTTLRDHGWFWLWLVGVVMFAGRARCGHRRLRQLIQSSSRASKPILAQYAQMANALPCRIPVHVRLHPNLSTPLLYGLRQPVILLPAGLDCEAHRAESLGALAHELSHLAARDLWWNVLIHGVCCGLWLHPLLWRIRSVHDAACDQVSDAVAAQALGCPRRYAQALARVALGMLKGPRVYAGLPMSHKADIRQRLAALDKPDLCRRLQPRWTILASFVGLASVILLALIAVVPAAAPLSVPASETQPVSDSSPVRAFSLSGAEIEARAAQLLRQIAAKGNELSELLASGRGPRTVGGAPRLIQPPATLKPPFSDAARNQISKERFVLENELLKLGPRAAPYLVAQMMKRPDQSRAHYDLRLHAWLALQEMGPAARGVIPDLIRGLEAGDPWLEQRCAVILREMGPAAKAAIPALTRRLPSHCGDVAFALACIDPQSEPALKALIEIIRRGEENPNDVVTAALTLPKMGPKAAAAVPALLEALALDIPPIQETVAHVLKIIGTPEAVQVLRPALNHTNGSVRMHAAEAVLQQHPGHPQGAAVLLACLKDKDAKLRNAAVISVLSSATALGINPTQLTEALMSVIRDDAINENLRHYQWTRSWATAGLRKLGLKTPAVLSLFREKLQDHDDLVRLQASISLLKLDGRTNTAVSVLTDLLHSRQREARSRAVVALTELTPRSTPTLAELRGLLRDEEPLVRVVAARALWKLDHDADATVPVLIKVLEHNLHLWLAMEVLGEVGPSAKAAVPVLKQAVWSKRSGAYAAEALAKIDPRAAKELPKMDFAVSNPDLRLANLASMMGL